MTFIEIYKSLDPTPPKEQWVNRVAEVTKKHPNSVRRWLSGKVQPDRLTQQILAMEFATPVDILFPK